MTYHTFDTAPTRTEAHQTGKDPLLCLHTGQTWNQNETKHQCKGVSETRNRVGHELRIVG